MFHGFIILASCFVLEIAAAEAVAERPRRRRTSSRSRKRTLSGRSISDHSDMETEAFDIDNILKENKHKSSNSHNTKGVLNGTTVELSDETCVPDDLRLELREFVKEKLYSRYVLSMSELKRLLNVKLSQSPPGHILGKGVTEKLFEQTVEEIGGYALHSKVNQCSLTLFNLLYKMMCRHCGHCCRL